jgi:4-nitrophenyl phosphatase
MINQQTLRSIRALILDMDGVLYRSTEPLPGAAEFIDLLQQESTPFLVATNNAMRTPAEHAQRLQSMGIPLREEDLLTSAQATALYLKRIAPPGAKVYLMGSDGLRSEIERQGFVLVSWDEAHYVVVGIDWRLTYQQLKEATLAIRRGIPFIGTNPDKTFPTPQGEIPGCGAILAALEAATGVTPTIIGKPQPTLYEMAIERLGADRTTTAAIGDRIETDIAGAKNAGLVSILVLCGVTSCEKLTASLIQPDLVFNDLRELAKAWRNRYQAKSS